MIGRKRKNNSEANGFCFEKEGERKFLIFRISKEEYGVDLSYIREVVKVKEVRPIPHIPEWMEGVTNLRGHLIALLSLRRRLNLKESEEPDRKMIVCQIQRRTFGLLVEELGEILSLPQEKILPVPEVLSKLSGRELVSEIAQIGGRMIPLLNPERILTLNEERSI